jgi:hypothetical protein
MNTDQIPDLRRGGESKLLYKEETGKIIGAAFEVLNKVGHGLKHAQLEWDRIVV